MTPGKHSSQCMISSGSVCTDLLISENSYALSELQKDVDAEILKYPVAERQALRDATKFGVFVVHNKLKPKLAELPADLP